MANVLNRTTLAYLRSVHDPDYPDPPWLHNPDMSAVAGVPPRYWKLTGDVVSEMSQAEKDAVDAQMLSDQRDSVADQLDVTEDVIRAFALVVLDEINTLRAQHSLADRTIAQMKSAVRGKLGM